MEIALFFILILFLLPNTFGSQMIFEIPDGNKQCFYENLNSTLTYLFEFQVSESHFIINIFLNVYDIRFVTHDCYCAMI